MDIPHHMFLCLKSCCRKSTPFEKKAIEDDYFFDLGYHLSFVVVVFTIVFLFSVTAPLISFFGFLFFGFKYFVDKYNFIWVYPKEMDSTSRTHATSSGFLMFALFLFQILMFGLFTAVIGREFIVASLILLVGEIISIFIFRYVSRSSDLLIQ